MTRARKKLPYEGTAPRWRVWVHDYHEVGDDADSWEVHARDAENAAEVALATHNDEGQYVERERETLVFVRRLDTGEQRWIRVYSMSIGEGIYVGEQQPRDGQGRIIGCTALTTGRSSLPGAALGLRPAQIAVFGGAARWVALANEEKWVVPHPNDIDAVYAGLDLDQAERLVRQWARVMGIPDRIPLDLHHSPREAQGSGTCGLSIPRPPVLAGEDGTVPQDTAWSRVLGDAPVVFHDAWTLGAMFRRLGVIEAYRGRAALPAIVRAVFDPAADRSFAVSLDLAETPGNDYGEGTLGAARRAFVRLGETGPWLLGELEDMPVAKALRTILGDWTPSPAVRARAIAGAGRVSPSRHRGCGALYVSHAGALPGYPDALHSDPAWLLS